MCIPTYRYECDYLLRHRRGAGYPPSNTIQYLKTLKLFQNQGSRGGRSVVRPIKVTVTDRSGQTWQAEARKHTRVETPRQWFNLPSLLLSNVTSLTNKMDELIVTVRSTRADIVAITEAWQIVPEVCMMQDVQLFHHLRSERRDGGVAVYYRSTLSPSHLPVAVPAGVEALWVGVTPFSHLRHSLHHPLCCIPPPTWPDSTTTH
ncbi:hypothetical protein E2C01_069083 [Portunus trituberculatus]|uniref:Uncharacterized protein n=1 Tax=Portunus trituberculatus TaxID=210409 RepID=A0A5B7HYF7_PORTR|nr:hypothetical protein [Portunus trituberculatus]